MALIHTLTILTCVGLRGGIFVAQVLPLPMSPTRDALVRITYAVVVFSILVQWLTINQVLGNAARSSLGIHTTDMGRADLP